MDDQKLLKAPMKSGEVRHLAITSAFMVITILLLEVAMKQIIRARIIDQTKKIFLKHFVDGVIEDLLDLTDSEESTSSTSNDGIYEYRKPFVLELHDLVKDEPDSETTHKEAKVKKLKKKKKPINKTRTSGTSSSDSESSVPPSAHSKEEFYDAHESYHGLAASAAIMQALPEDGPVLKVTDEPASTQRTSASKQEPSTAITKPTSDPK